MTGTVLFLLIVVAVFVAVGKTSLLKGLLGREGGQKVDWPVYAKRLLTPNEQKCYHRLRTCYPNHVVLAQVSLSQMLGLKKGHGKNYQSILNRFRQLTADFVLCNRDFSIAAVFELDDRSHDNPTRQSSDARKAQALEAAGIPLHRLNSARLPDEVDLKGLPVKGSGTTGSANL